MMVTARPSRTRALELCKFDRVPLGPRHPLVSAQCLAGLRPSLLQARGGGRLRHLRRGEGGGKTWRPGRPPRMHHRPRSVALSPKLFGGAPFRALAHSKRYRIPPGSPDNFVIFWGSFSVSNPRSPSGRSRKRCCSAPEAFQEHLQCLRDAVHDLGLGHRDLEIALAGALVTDALEQS